MHGEMILLLLIGLTASVHGSPYSGSSKSLLAEQVHLSLTDKPNEVVITWSTKEMTEDSLVEYGPDPQTLKKVTGNMTYFEECGKEGCRKQYIHRVKLTNLESNMTYIYHAGSTDGAWSPMFHFKTHPATVPPGYEHTDGLYAPHVLVFGDLGTLNAKALPYIEEEVIHRRIDGVIHVGDFAYDLDWESGALGDTFMRQIEPIAAYVPYMTCPGNHEEKRLDSLVA